VIREAVEEVPEGGHVIVTSRRSPPQQLARLRANQALGLIDGSDLRLTLSETEGVVRSLLREPLPKEIIAWMHNAVDGWAAGLVLILERLKTGEKPLEPTQEQIQQIIFDYFASEVFSRTDRETRDVLLNTAFLPRLTAEIAERLTGRTEAGVILDNLSRDHSFTYKHNGGVPAYQYHPLFRDFLMNEACKTLPAEHRLEIQQLSAVILAEQGQTENAMALLRETGSWESVAELETGPIAQWPWPIKIFTLGRFSLVKGDRPVAFSRKSQRRSLEFLKVLISLGGRNVSEEDLIDALWPDAEGHAAHGALSITVHRLRALLGHREALQRQGGKLTLDARLCWVDLWALERLLTRAERAVQNQNNGEGWSEASRLVEKTLSLYHGPFLSGDVCRWATTISDRVRRRLLRALSDLGKHWETTAEWQKAVHCYEKAVEINPCAEPFYQRLMFSYRHLGDRSEVQSTYERCKRVLAAMMGIAPLPETETIYNSLWSGVNLLAILLPTDDLTLALTSIIEASL
jgi:DNA-binding SARP family transcriptional activator